MSPNLKIAIIVPCMGRLRHLMETLPLMLNQDCSEYIVVVVNWSSPDRLKQYLLENPNPRLYEADVPNKQFFSLSGARNAGGDFLIEKNLIPTYIAFIDADVKLPTTFLSKNLLKTSPICFLQRNKTLSGDLSMWGSCIAPFDFWRKVRYNEQIDTYGEEDNEFYNVLKSKGCFHTSLNTEGVEIIKHSDDLRMQFYRESPDQIPELKKANKKKFRIQ